MKTVVDMELNQEALLKKANAISGEMDKAYESADLDAYVVLENRYKETIGEAQKIAEFLKEEAKRMAEKPLDWGWEIKEGHYYNGWLGRWEKDASAVFCKELCKTELKTLQILSERKWEQDSQGRLYFRVPYYRETCWGDASGERVIRTLAPFIPMFQERLDRQEKIKKMRSELLV